MSRAKVNLAQNGQSEQSVSSSEVAPKAQRRRFSTSYKWRIVEEASRCTEHGAIGALLRREGLYSSQLAKWRRQYEAGELNSAQGRRRGRKPKQSAAERERERLQRENERLREQLAQAELIIAAQKKLAQALEQTLGRSEESTA
jgi:transposase-like protein